MDATLDARPDRRNALTGVPTRPAPVGGRRPSDAGPPFPVVSWSLPGEVSASIAAAPGAPTLALPGPYPGLAAEPPAALLAGWRRYRDLELAGAGGMGRVYHARDRRTGADVAVKFLLDAREPAEKLREARLQARVSDPGVLAILGRGELDRYGWFAMPYVAGCTLKSARRGMDLAEATGLMVAVCRTVAAIHRAGLVHCDLNPRNVLVGPGPSGPHHPWVIDFGIAQEVSAPRSWGGGQRVVGTPSYMAPEQAMGKNHLLDPRTDIYGLGATLYELASGQRPFAAETSEAILTKAIHEDPLPLSELGAEVPPGLERIVLTCLEKDPADRYASADELADELELHALARALPLRWSSLPDLPSLPLASRGALYDSSTPPSVIARASRARSSSSSGRTLRSRASSRTGRPVFHDSLAISAARS